MKPSKKIINNLRSELNKSFKPLHKMVDIKSWYKKIVKQSRIKIKTIPLNKCKNWKVNKKGFILNSVTFKIITLFGFLICILFYFRVLLNNFRAIYA